jgi:hypothetical protein
MTFKRHGLGTQDPKSHGRSHSLPSGAQATPTWLHHMGSSSGQMHAINTHQEEGHTGIQDHDDAGMQGSLHNDHVIIHNTHPHAQHSTGFDTERGAPTHQHYENHQIQAVHIIHHKRDKLAEHHPPAGLMDMQTSDMTKDTPTVF